MNGVVLAFGACFSCGRPFTFNPHKVPSLRVEGVREPVCSGCMGLVNAKRIKMGLQPHPIAEDAYEAIPEGDL